MTRLAILLALIVSTFTATTAADARNLDLVLDPAFSAEEVAVITESVAVWQDAGMALRIGTVGPVNVKRITGAALPSAEGGNAVQLAAANQYGILVWIDAIKSNEQLLETMTHELTHYMGVDYHSEDGDCTNAFTIHCAGGPSKSDIAHVHAAQH